MNTQAFVNSLFEGYEETVALTDFKEELLANLNAKIENLMKKGLDEKTAFEKATTELGDVSALADELSLKKRNEILQEVYMGIQQYMSKSRVAGYIAFGALLLLGAAIGATVFFATRSTGFPAMLSLTAMFGSILPFITVTVAGFTWLGMTQETATAFPASKKRAAWYAAAAALIAFAIFTMPVTFFGTMSAIETGERFTSEVAPYMQERFAERFRSHSHLPLTFEQGVPTAIALIPLIGLIITFLLPGIGLLAFLILTEKERLKPWAKNLYGQEQYNLIWNSPEAGVKFGMISGAIWIFAVAIFLTLGFLASWSWSWIIFIFATGLQALLPTFFMKRKEKN
ncbi:MAG: permease prefix domain 1-containing protein [Spirochaetaceae bacterium]|nr:permease prefix domain 1-containing protein [Spirochaetaceae bacterium]